MAEVALHRRLQDRDIHVVRTLWRGSGLTLEEQRGGATVLLRGRASPEVLGTVASVLGCELPPPGPRLAGSPPRVLGVSPNRWLILDEKRSERLIDTLACALVGSGLYISDLSSGRVRVRVGGLRAAELLAAGTEVDLACLPVDHAVLTGFALTEVLIVREAGGFVLEMDASYASYVREWLIATGSLVVAIPPDLQGTRLPLQG
jgi:heterotetrameric sarcosine oxidase gamma subunit